MDILDKYVRHDVERLLKDYSYHKRTLEQLKERLEELTEISAQNYSGVSGSSSISDNTSRVALERVNLKDKCDRYSLDLLAIDRAIWGLSEEEIKVIKALYINPIGITKASIELNMSQSNIYSIKDKAIKKLENVLY